MTNSSKGVVIMDEVLAVCSQIGTWEIKANFNCAQTWPSYSTISLIHTVFIALSLFLLVLLVILTIILYRRNQNSIKASDNPSQKNESNPPLSQNSDRDTSTTTIYDDDIHIPDSGSLIRGPPVDDASIIRENCFKQQIDAKNEIFFKSTPMTTFKPNQNISCPMSNIPTNYCVAWTQSHAAFQPSDENVLENQSLEEQSSISCLPEKDDSQHIYANVNENHRGYANLISNHFNKRNETIYANDVMIQGNKNTFDQFVYSQIKPNK
ncbi:uncharacterized protein [Lepeophtheirus salmonis]|uniref:uncharacterized protein isoform X2 n=1 Tax=Lepeophtheirus salmonis TaxID=72036 RepID=UPI001AE8ED64|nr:uncharacterized protein LOC121126146 isoform X2 [Lepeophtheirus salmonis]